MANRDLCRKHNMIANLEKTPSNFQFHDIIDFLTGSSINYSLLVNPKIIGPWIQEFWSTADKEVEEEENVITATVARHPIRIQRLLFERIYNFKMKEGHFLLIMK